MACGFYSEGSLHDRVMPTFSALFFKKGKEGTNLSCIGGLCN